MDVLTTYGGSKRQSYSPQKVNYDTIDVTKYEKDFIAFKYAYQLSKKRDRLLSALDYYTQMPEAQFIKIDVKSKDFCFDKNLKLYLKGMDVRKNFIENYQDFYNPKSITLTSVLSQISNKIIQLFEELSQLFLNKFQTNSIKSYIDLNNEKTGQYCQNKAEECRKQMLQQIPIQDQPELNGYIDSQEFFSLCKKYFTTIPIKEQVEILNSFFHYFIHLNQGGKYAAYNNGLKGISYTSSQNLKTVYINQSQFDNTIYIPKYILEQLIEQGIHGIVLHSMINMNITILNAEGQQKMMQKFR